MKQQSHMHLKKSVPGGRVSHGSAIVLFPGTGILASLLIPFLWWSFIAYYRIAAASILFPTHGSKRVLTSKNKK